MWIIVTINAAAEEVGRTYLKPGVPATIGRAPDRTIFLAVPSISRCQGRIEVRNGMPVYFDDETSTGALFNGSYVRGPTTLDEKSVLEIGGFRFYVERDPLAKPPRPVAARATAQPAPAEVDWAAEGSAGAPAGDMDMAAMLAQRITGIRMHREQQGDGSEARRARIREEWARLVESARALQRKLGADPRIQAFLISRDEDEIMLKVAEPRSERGFCSLILARNHPDGKYPDLDGAWLLELGQKESHFSSPKEALDEFVHRLAPRLA